MLNLNLSDSLLFGNDAGEDEKPEILASYFVGHPDFEIFWNTERRLQIARARKGMGKSALLAKLGYDLRQKNDGSLVITVTGADLTGMGEFSSEDPAVLVNQWQQVLCARINMELGRQLSWAGTDTTIMMVEGAELAGFRGRNIVGVLIDRLKARTFEIQKIAPTNQTELLKRFSSSTSPPLVWLLIDDIDSTFLNSTKLKNKVSSFFSACRRITQLVEGLRIRATVRADVWSVLRDNEDLDKCEQYVTDIRWSGQEMGNILSKKIFAYVQRTHPRSMVAQQWSHIEQQEGLIGLAFTYRLSWGDSVATPLRVINIFAAKRPRWLAQLCRLAGAETTRLRKNRIDMQAINIVMPQFGKYRISDLYKEHSHQFSDIKKLIESFARGPRRYTTKELLERVMKHYISRVGAANLPEIDGAPEKTNALQLCHFLFKTGFLQGRSDAHESPTYIEYDDRPILLTTAINIDDGLVWDIHPSYRNVLNIT